MPIPILQYGVKVRDPTTKEFSDLAALRGGQGPQGAAGPGVSAGGTDGDVLVKNGATDYDATWKKTPPQMGSLATIETSPVENPNGYQQGDYLVYNGQLYKVTGTISHGETLTPGGNIQACNIGDAIKIVDVSSQITAGTVAATMTAASCYKIGNIVCFNVQFNVTGNIPIWGVLAQGFPKQSAGGDIIFGYLGGSNTMSPAYINSQGQLVTRTQIASTGILLLNWMYMTTN